MLRRLSKHTPKGIGLVAGALMLGLAFSVGIVLADDPGQGGKPGPAASPNGPAVAAPVNEPRPVGPAPSGDNHNVGSITATGNACFGGSACAAGYQPGQDLEVIDGDPTLRMMNNAAGDSIFWDIGAVGNVFRVWDRTVSNLNPFSIENDTPSNALYLDSTGNVGMGTNAPGTQLHLNDAAAEIRLRIQSVDDRTDLWQGNSGLWFQNVFNGGAATNPFKIDNGTPTDTLTLNNNGFVGFGTASPLTLNHLRRTAGDVTMRMERASGGAVLDFTAGPAATAFGSITNHSLFLVSNAVPRMVITNTGLVSIGNFIPAHPLHMASGAHVTAGGIWTNASSRALKRDFTDVDAKAVLDKVAELPVQSWSYNAEDASIRHLGPTSEDFYAAFGFGGDDKSIGTLDASGVTMVALQGLYNVVKEKDAVISEQAKQLASLEQRLSAIENGGPTVSPSASQAAIAADGSLTQLLAIALVVIVLGGVSAYGLRRKLAA